MYKCNKNDNMTKELVWSSGQCFSWSLERLGFEFWLLQFTCILWAKHMLHQMLRITNFNKKKMISRIQYGV